MERPPRYQHTALPGDRWIRLFRFVPQPASSSCDTTVCLELAKFPLDHVPSYEALSYTWGSATRDAPFVSERSDTESGTTRNVLINGYVSDILLNLYEAIMAWRQIWLDEQSSSGPATSGNQRTSGAATDGGWLWADAICINQEDTDEKGVQVSMMGELYTQARRVIIWLGSDTRDLDDFQWIHTTFWDYYRPNYKHLYGTQPAFLSPEVLEAMGVYNVSEWHARWAAYARFYCRRRWFSRIWVIQECACAREITVLCGLTKLDWKRMVSMSDVTVITWWGPSILDNFVRATNASTGNDTSSAESPELLTVAAAEHLMNGAIALFDVWRRTTNGLDGYVTKGFVQPLDPDSPLREWLGCLRFLFTRSSYAGCSLAHDKIFALLGIAQRFLPPTLTTASLIGVTRYDQPVEVLYSRVAALIMQHAPHPDILFWVQNPALKSLTSLPSWCPDFSVAAGFIPISWVPPRKGEDWRSHCRINSSGDVPTEVVQRGAMIDSIAAIAPPFPSKNAGFYLSLMAEFCSGVNDGAYKAATQQDKLEVFWRTLLFDFDLSTGVAYFPVQPDMGQNFVSWLLYNTAKAYDATQSGPGAETGLTDGMVDRSAALMSQYSAIRNALSGCSLQLPSLAEVKSLCAQMNDLGKSRCPGGRESNVGEQQLRESKESETYPMVTVDPDLARVEAGWRRFDRQMGAYNKNYSLFLTSNGYLGAGLSPLSIGDEVWRLYGIGVPFVLQRHHISGNTGGHGDGQPHDHYLLKGNAYLHGFMGLGSGEQTARGGETEKDGLQETHITII